jgi:hypothetical protein
MFELLMAYASSSVFDIVNQDDQHTSLLRRGQKVVLSPREIGVNRESEITQNTIALNFEFSRSTLPMNQKPRRTQKKGLAARRAWGRRGFVVRLPISRWTWGASLDFDLSRGMPGQ